MRNRSPDERLLGIVLHLIISRIASDAERDRFETRFGAPLADPDNSKYEQYRPLFGRLIGAFPSVLLYELIWVLTALSNMWQVVKSGKVCVFELGNKQFRQNELRLQWKPSRRLVLARY